MMRLKVVKVFADKVTYKMYAIGETITLPDDRAENAIKQGLAVEVADKVEAKDETEEPKEVKPKKKPAKKATKKG